MKMRTGHFEADGNAVNIFTGFKPSKVVLFNADAVAGEVFRVDWFGSEMGNAKEIKTTVLADNGSTGNLNLDYASSGGSLSSLAQSNLGDQKSVTFDYTGGASEDLITCTEVAGHGLSNGDQVRLVESGGLATGLSAAITYYVINATATTFQLSLTKGGSAVEFTSDGTAPNYVYSLTDFVLAGGDGFTVAAAFMDDGDEIWYEAYEADTVTDHGDQA